MERYGLNGPIMMTNSAVYVGSALCFETQQLSVPLLSSKS